MINRTNNYSFGSKLDGTVFGSEYRYGFDRNEKNEEWSEGNYDFGERIEDSRIGRFFSVDPASDEFVSSSPYSFAVDNPIYFDDENGERPIRFRFRTRFKETDRRGGGGLFVATYSYWNAPAIGGAWYGTEISSINNWYNDNMQSDVSPAFDAQMTQAFNNAEVIDKATMKLKAKGLHRGDIVTIQVRYEFGAVVNETFVVTNRRAKLKRVIDLNTYDKDHFDFMNGATIPTATRNKGFVQRVAVTVQSNNPRTRRVKWKRKTIVEGSLGHITWKPISQWRIFNKARKNRIFGKRGRHRLIRVKF